LANAVNRCFCAPLQETMRPPPGSLASAPEGTARFRPDPDQAPTGGQRRRPTVGDPGGWLSFRTTRPVHSLASRARASWGFSKCSMRASSEVNS